MVLAQVSFGAWLTAWARAVRICVAISRPGHSSSQPRQWRASGRFSLASASPGRWSTGTHFYIPRAGLDFWNLVVAQVT